MAGQTPKCLTAFANLKKICDEHLAGGYDIEIVDLLDRPQFDEGGSDSRESDIGAETAVAGAQNHRRSLQCRPGTGRVGPAASLTKGLPEIRHKMERTVEG